MARPSRCGNERGLQISKFGLIVMRKRVYIVWSHHHAIKEWFRYRELGLHLLSFDYHTDFHQAFLRSSCTSSQAQFGVRPYTIENHNLVLKKHIGCRDEDALEVAVNELRNDEHIDFAIRSGMIKRAFVFSCASSSFKDGRVLEVPAAPPIEMIDDHVQMMMKLNSLAPKVLKEAREGEEDLSTDILVGKSVEVGIVSFSEFRHPLLEGKDESESARLVTTDGVLNEVLETFREQGFNKDNYILDIDCDFIRDRGAMVHEQFKTLEELIKGAKAITIAREPDCVRECSGQTLSYEDVEGWLVELIKGCIDADIKYEYDTDWHSKIDGTDVGLCL